MEDSSAKEMYEMGKRLCEMAEAMGYSGEESEAEEVMSGEDETAMPEKYAAPHATKGKKGKLEIAMGFLK